MKKNVFCIKCVCKKESLSIFAYKMVRQEVVQVIVQHDV